MGLDAGPLGPRICDRSSRGHPGMGTRVSIHRTACLSDLVRQRPLSASRGETRGDTYRNRHPCTFGAEDSRLETSARRLTRKRTPRARPDRQLHASHICIVARPGDIPEYWPRRVPHRGGDGMLGASGRSGAACRDGTRPCPEGRWLVSFSTHARGSGGSGVVLARCAISRASLGSGSSGLTSLFSSLASR